METMDRIIGRRIIRLSSELLDGGGFAGHLVGVLLPQLLHAGDEAHLVGPEALQVHGGHLHPHHHLGLHALDRRELAPGQGRLHAGGVPYHGGVLEAHLAGLGQVHHEPRARLVVLVADDVPREEARREVVLAQQVREGLVWFA